MRNLLFLVPLLFCNIAFAQTSYKKEFSLIVTKTVGSDSPTLTSGSFNLHVKVDASSGFKYRLLSTHPFTTLNISEVKQEYILATSLDKNNPGSFELVHFNTKTKSFYSIKFANNQYTITAYGDHGVSLLGMIKILEEQIGNDIE